MIHVVRIYQSAPSRKNKAAQKIHNSHTTQDLETSGRTGLILASRSCSLLKVDPQVLHRHPVMGVRAAFATFIRDGLNDNPSSPPHCRHKRLAKIPLLQLRLSSSDSPSRRRRSRKHPTLSFLSSPVTESRKHPTLGEMPRVGC